MSRTTICWGWLAAFLLGTAPAIAQTPRDLLTDAAFETRSRDAALALVERARTTAIAAASRQPGEQEPAVLAAVAQGYRAKLLGSRAETTLARKQFEAVASRFPRNAEAQIGLAAWHLGVIGRVGKLVGRVVGAQQGAGMQALQRSVAFGGDRAMFVGMAGMMLVKANPKDQRGRTWIETAARAPTPTAIDRIIRRSAQAIAGAYQKGDLKQASALADRLLPFGWYKPK